LLLLCKGCRLRIVRSADYQGYRLCVASRARLICVSWPMIALGISLGGRGRMAVQLGSGEYIFEVNEHWAKVPEEITLGDCAAVGVDRQNRVYAFNRGEHPVAVFDAEGNLLRTWGEGLFHRPHGVHMGPDDTVWLTDDGDHTVRKCAL